MSRVTGGLVGIAVGVMSTLAVQRALISVGPGPAPASTTAPSDPVPTHTITPPDTTRMAVLFDAGQMLLETTLPGSKCLDVSVTYPSTHEVGYVYDALYDLQLTYRYRGVIKRTVLPVGFTGGVTVVPTSSQVVIADDTAQVVHTLRPEATSTVR